MIPKTRIQAGTVVEPRSSSRSIPSASESRTGHSSSISSSDVSRVARCATCTSIRSYGGTRTFWRHRFARSSCSTRPPQPFASRRRSAVRRRCGSGQTPLHRVRCRIRSPRPARPARVAAGASGRVSQPPRDPSWAATYPDHEPARWSARLTR